MVNFGLNITDIKASELINLVNTPMIILTEEKDSILLPHRIVCSYFPRTTNYSTSSSNLVFTLSGLVFGSLDASLLSLNTASSSLINVSDCQNVINNKLINQPLLLQNLGENLTDGDGNLKVFVWYSTVTF